MSKINRLLKKAHRRCTRSPRYDVAPQYAPSCPERSRSISRALASKAFLNSLELRFSTLFEIQRRSTRATITRRRFRAARPRRAATSSLRHYDARICARASSPICASTSALLVHSQPNSVPSVPQTMRSAPYNRTAASIARGPNELQSTYTFARRKRDDGSSSFTGIHQGAVIHALDLVRNVAAEIVNQDRRIGVGREDSR